MRIHTYKNRRPGTIIPMLAITCAAMMMFVALAVDLGMLTVARTECQSAADAAALAGARVLNNKPTATNNDKTTAESTATTVATYNSFTNSSIQTSQVTTATARVYWYNTSTQKFELKSTKGTGESWTAMEVQLTVSQPTFFAKVLGVSSMPNGARAVAAHRPRDVSIVLDFTGSMKFGSTMNWDADSYRTGGLLMHDDLYPQFAHYQRYDSYAKTYASFGTSAGLTNTNYYSGTVANRPHPFVMGNSSSAGYYNSSGERMAIGNQTLETAGGPPIVQDFYYDPTATGATITAVANLRKAFHHWDPTTSGGNPYTYVAPTRDFSAYNASTGLLPTPSNYADQSEQTATGGSLPAYSGDKYPRKKGKIFLAPTTWNPGNTSGAAINLADYLGWWDSSSYTGGALPAMTVKSRTGMTPSTAYAANWTNFRDAAWERYGYDLDVDHYVTNRPSNWDPRWDWNIDTNAWVHPGAGTTSIVPNTVTFRPRRKTSGTFQGYSMGPGYWGKTFFIWPPDPRTANDWRQKFFFRADGTAFNTQADNNTGTTGSGNIESVNEVLMRNSVQTTLPSSPTWNNPPGSGQTTVDSNHVLTESSNYRVNYNAVLTWIRSGPQTLPSNLRAGRILYYSAIPTTIPTSNLSLDQLFWRNYIDFVIGNTLNTNYRPSQNIAGTEPRGWPEGNGPTISTVDLTAFNATDPIPYMNYTDNPLRPRGHFWFGPITMMDFIASSAPNRNWTAGTTHESQCWQLKAGMNSALDDIRNNHPNDSAGLVFFSYDNFSTPRVTMGQNWTDLKNSLFYPNSLLSSIVSSPTTEVRPYDSSFNSALTGNIPNANGGTDPNSGLAMAFNQLAPSGGGRRGASKVVVIETDGVPNSYVDWSPLPSSGSTPAAMSNGYNSVFTRTGSGSSPGNGNSTSINRALAIVKQTVKQVSANTSGDSGHSLPNSPARVYAIGFGDLFDTPSATFQSTARTFLLNIQQAGNTSTATDTALPTEQIITGVYQRPYPNLPEDPTSNPPGRIEKLRTAMEKIMQGGVQVALIE